MTFRILGLFCVLYLIVHQVEGFAKHGVEVGGITSHRNNFLEIDDSTNTEWNVTLGGVSQWMGSFTLVYGALGITVRDEDGQDGDVTLLDYNSGKVSAKYKAKSWGQVQGSLTPKAPNAEYLFIIDGQSRIQGMDVSTGMMYDWPIIATNLWFNNDFLLYGTELFLPNMIYIDHGGPCRSEKKMTDTKCAWLYSFQLTKHFNNWLRTDIPDANFYDSITKDYDDIIYLMDSSSELSTCRLWKIFPQNGSTLEIVEFEPQFSAYETQISVSNIKTANLHNYYFVQLVSNSNTLSNGWYLFGYSKDDNKNVLAVNVDDIADPSDGCFEVTISENGDTLYVVCQNWSDMKNTLLSVDVASKKVNFKKELNPYEYCAFVTETMNGKIVVTCSNNEIPAAESSNKMMMMRKEKRRGQNPKKNSGSGKRGIVILKKEDGSILETIDLSNVYMGLRALVDSKHNVYYCYYYGNPTKTTCEKKSLV